MANSRISLATYCTNNSLNLLEIWDYEKNSLELFLTPSTVSYMSHKEVYWVCKEGHPYSAKVYTQSRALASGCPICSGMRVLKGVNDLESAYPDIANEWDYSKNELSPQEVTPKSHKYAWWLCKNNHSWQAKIYSRVEGRGCSQCTTGGTSFPEQAILYYARKQGLNAESRQKIKGVEVDILISDIQVAVEYDGSIYHNDSIFETREVVDKVRVCKDVGIVLYKICGFSSIEGEKTSTTYWYKDTQDASNKYRGLTHILSIFFNNLKESHNLDGEINIDVDRDKLSIKAQYEVNREENSYMSVITDKLLSLWDYDKNKGLTPSNFSKGANDNVWWKCNKGHSWQNRLDSALINSGECRVCNNLVVEVGFNDLETTHQAIAKEWDYLKNKNIKPQDVTCRDSRKVYWKCPVCKKTQFMSINDKVKVGVCNNKVGHSYSSMLGGKSSPL